jgi:hypothetical protein
VQLGGVWREGVFLSVDEALLPARPDRPRIASHRSQTLPQVTRGQGVIIVHRPDVRARANKRDGVAIRVEAAPGPGHESRTKSFSNLCGGCRIIAIFGDHDFKRLHFLRAYAGQAALEAFRPVARDDRDAQANGVTHAASCRAKRRFQ